LAQLGSTFGLITAGHVLKELERGEVGIVRFPDMDGRLQNLRLDLGHTSRTNMWPGNEGDVPDLDFLKIPELDAKRLEALGSVFYNLGRERNFARSKPNHRMSKAYAVVGVIGEWTDVEEQAEGRKIIVGGLFGAAKITREFEENGVALVEVAIDYDQGPTIPKSYEGVSGGALWELHPEHDEEMKVVRVNKKLHGVAFLQSKDNRLIVCNAGPSIEVLKNTILDAWPNG
jgi:hypothetical protein